MVMVSDKVEIDLQGITKNYLQIKPSRDDYPDTLRVISNLVGTTEHYPFFMVYQEGAGDTLKPIILVEYDGIEIKEAYDEVKKIVDDKCKFGQVKLIHPSSFVLDSEVELADGP